MKIYITRHGETEWNKEGRLQGWKNSNLTEKGIRDAKKLGDRLKDINFDYIYSSPQGRALDTAKYIRGHKDTEIIIFDSLKEMGFGKWEGMENKEIEILYPIEYFNFWNKPHLYRAVEGESFDDLFNRIKNALNRIINDNAEENVLIVSHGVAIKSMYSIIKGCPLKELWNSIFIKNNSLTIAEVADGNINFILESDTSHLE
ncbi:histidine phosphatase family protein [Tissierella praeacuta]|uniref:histidine phosphatase family protein n=1 Tax=Tissierella praeacuta TaxID=43131 RepID=UPI0033425EDC